MAQWENDGSSLQVVVSSNTDRVTARRHSLKRSLKACLQCRARKVRCDVTLKGIPCMNCRLDNGDCVVRERPTKYRKTKHTTTDATQRNTSSEHSEHSHNSRPNNRALVATQVPQTHSFIGPEEPSEASSFSTEKDQTYTGKGNSSRHELITDVLAVPTLRHDQNSEENLETSIGFQDMEHAVRETTPWSEVGAPLELRAGSEVFFTRNNCALAGSPRPAASRNMTEDAIEGCVLYSQYSFLKSDDFSHVPAQDINFLGVEGALHVPAKPELDQFLMEYFRHIHPQLPLFDEAAFWIANDEFYSTQNQKYQVSIFTFQSMLFACCNFVPLTTLKKVGFTSFRHARATLYRRAKLLYDLDGKRDYVSTAQGALLLSYSPDNHNRKLNTLWLGIGIQFAKDADAHRYNSPAALSRPEQNAKKRLWWCCILRDRILPLGVRRPLHITRDHFDFINNPPLTVSDLSHEFQYSKVYDTTMKRLLAELLAVLCELAIVLTDVINVVYPVSETPIGLLRSEADISQIRSRIRRCKSGLSQWLDSASVRFPIPAGLGNPGDAPVLFTNFMYLYYHAAKIALCHHELVLAENRFSPNSFYPLELTVIKTEIQESVFGVTDLVKEFVQLGLAKHMPISVVAYIGLPLVLHILNVKLSSTRSQCSLNQRRLQIFMEAMQILQSQYDGTDQVSSYIERLIVYLAKEDPSNKIVASESTYTVPKGLEAMMIESPSSGTSDSAGLALRDWGDVLSRQTSWYLRIVWTLDISFRKGRFPDESDFPAKLQSNQLSKILPLYHPDPGTPQSELLPRKSKKLRSKNIQSSKGDRTDFSANMETNQQSKNSLHERQCDVHLDELHNTNQNDESSRQAFDHLSSSEVDIMSGSSGIQAFSRIELESWIYDVLPPFS